MPNLCYIGGGGELAYWLELKSNFESNRVVFPILLLRNSVVIVSDKQITKIEKLNLTWRDLFLKQEELKNTKTKEISNFKIDFSQQKDFLKKQFQELYTIAEVTDKSFIGAVAAQEKKQIKGLENLEKRLLKAEKKANTEYLDRILKIQNELFPNQSLQERNRNFSEFVLEFNLNNLLIELKSKLNPLSNEFQIIIL